MAKSMPATASALEAAEREAVMVRTSVQATGEEAAMSIRDIIEAASVPLQNWYSVDSLMHLRQGDREFIATFDPEHVALMEAVCEAAADVADEVTNGVPLGDNVVEFMDEDSDYLFIEKSLMRKLDDALERRAAYRKTYGYGD